MKSKCIGVLMEEHKIILGALDVLGAMSQTAAGTGSLDRDDVNGMIEILRVFADTFHQGKEEGALFPIYTETCGASEIDALRQMALEHERDRSMVEAMEDALLRADVREFSRYATHLEEILRKHLDQEDHVLFEMIDRSLQPENDARVLAEFEAYDRELDARGKGRLLHRLRMLEWKYLRKAA